MPSLTTPTTTKPRKQTQTQSHNNHNNHHNQTSLFCRNHTLTPTATLDLLILILVLISGTFLLTSYFSYLFTSLSLLLPSSSSLFHLPPIPPYAFISGIAFSMLLFFSFTLCRTVSGLFRPRRCGNLHCKGLKKALEFDLQLQTEDSVRNPVDFDKLPWKGGTESNPDYECLRAELRKMAPVNGRAVLLFRAKCGCPIAKLVGWAPKKGRKHKKAIASTASNGDHR